MSINLDKILEDAIILRDQGKYVEAEEILIGNSFDKFTNADVLSLIAHCRFLKGDIVNAAKYIDDARALDPKRPSVVWNFARIKLAQKDFLRAQETLLEGLNLYPESKEGRAVMGSFLRIIGKREAAIDLVNNLINEDEAYPEALALRGALLSDESKYQEAYQDLKQAYIARPHSPSIRNLLLKATIEAEKVHQILNELKYFEIGSENIGHAVFLTVLEQLEYGLVEPKNTTGGSNTGHEFNFLVAEALRNLGKDAEASLRFKLIDPSKVRDLDILFIVGSYFLNEHDLDRASNFLHRALKLNELEPRILNNIGVLHKLRGENERAIKYFDRALEVDDSKSNIHNNRGVALHNLCRIQESKLAFDNALKHNGQDPDIYWNLYGTSDNTDQATFYLSRCLACNPNYLKAKLHLNALDLFTQSNLQFSECFPDKLWTHPHVRSFRWLHSVNPKLSLLFNRNAFFEFVIKMADISRPFYEFGVWRGDSFKLLIDTFKIGYGFDTFTGLPESWHNEKAGSYSSEGTVPDIQGGIFTVGKFEDTLPEFFRVERPRASIINFDADLYSSTICALNHCQKIIDDHTILIFDEMIINENWEEDEYRALIEFTQDNNMEINLLAASFYTKQVAVKLKKV